MGTHLTPYLHFDGDAAAALAFYGDVLGGKISSMTFGEFGMEGPDAGKVMHGQIESDAGITLMCSDFPSHVTLQRGNAATVALSGDDAERLHGWWDGLSAGGTITTPLEKQMWGDEFGQFTDRFGVEWLVNIGTGSAT